MPRLSFQKTQVLLMSLCLLSDYKNYRYTFSSKDIKKEGETVSGTERILNFYVDMYSASYLVSAQPTQAKTAVVWCGYITFFVCGFTY